MKNLMRRMETLDCDRLHDRDSSLPLRIRTLYEYRHYGEAPNFPQFHMLRFE